MLSSDLPLLWFLNRATGVVVLVALTASIVLGVLGAGRSSGGRVPAFLSQHLHRNLSILALGLTAAHAVTAVVDEYVDIRWWQVFVPAGATYEPFWLGLGTLAWDLMVLVALTTWARGRLSHRAWHRIHLLGYLIWPTALAHGAGIGTDAGARSSVLLAAGCVTAVLLSVAIRVLRAARSRRGSSLSAVPQAVR